MTPTSDDHLTQLLATARAWVDDDPDAATRAELAHIIREAEGGDASAAADLAERFSGFLEFGTAGLRGALGAGPARMNQVVVLRAAAGFTTYLQEKLGKRDVTVVIGFDARHNSDVFARDTAAVVTAAGGRALVLPKPLPTPTLAFAIRHLAADAGVMVTASHNPPQDNGYKVYLGDGSQIVPPADREISTKIDTFPTAQSVPQAQDGWTVLDDDVQDSYIDAAVKVISPESARELSVVHTALHGVGSETFLRAFERAGFPPVRPVRSQQQPDPLFPTVAFPNPEEPGAIDAALSLAHQLNPDIVIASDPDADRCAVAVKDPTFATASDPSGWRMLRGDEVGTLLGYRAVRAIASGQLHGVDGGRGVVANSIVSSRQLGAIARAAGVEHRETLTGFKWIARVPDIAYGYEEALGYAVAPNVARDKDGITAALAMCELAAELKRQGSSVIELLDELAAEHGVFVTDSFSIRVSDLAQMPALMARLRQQPPTQIAGREVTEFTDLAADRATGSDALPPTDGLRFVLSDETRIIVRPSGTEPKVKVYLEAIESATSQGTLEGADVAGARAAARERLQQVREAMQELTAP